jgi:hypothetical protein
MLPFICICPGWHFACTASSLGTEQCDEELACAMGIRLWALIECVWARRAEESKPITHKNARPLTCAVHRYTVVADSMHDCFLKGASNEQRVRSNTSKVIRDSKRLLLLLMCYSVLPTSCQ